MIEEHELTQIECTELGFLKILTVSNNKTETSFQVFITYPSVFQTNYKIESVFLEGKDGEGIVFQTWLHIDETSNNSLKGSFINVINPHAISLSVEIKYIDSNDRNSMISGHLIKLGNLDSLSTTTYDNFLDWQVSP